jgi:DNA-binding NtrC family response regulator
VKLLRVLEERELTRVGGVTPIKVDVRVVAATNQPLRQRVEEGLFRSDLYYRLNVLSMYLPPLRERADDIPILVRQFVKDYSAQHDRTFHGISAEAMQILVSYSWPGNVRELRNLVESMVVLAPGREITAADIPREIREGGNQRFLPVHVGPVLRGSLGADGREMEFIVRSLVELKLQIEELRSRVNDVGATQQMLADGGSHGAPVNSRVLLSNGLEVGPAVDNSARVGALEPPQREQVPQGVMLTPGMTMAEIEKAAITAALAATRGNRRKAAEMLGIGERTMYRKLRDYDIPAH